MPDPSSIAILVVAAGKGLRAGAGLPKQYRLLAGRPLIAWTLAALRRALPASPIKVVIAADDAALYAAATDGLGLDNPVLGGAERQDSVRLGLEAFVERGIDTILIHDAARPFPSPETIHRSIEALAHPGIVGAAPALPVSDTLKLCDDTGRIRETLPRDGLWRVQTPQTFRFRDILQAHRSAEGSSLTDDLSVAQAAGMSVKTVLGDELNLKVTSSDDFKRAEAQMMLAAADTRVGQGFDVHAFCPGDHVMLGGLRIPHEFGLEGHSDADVALHAITDAILGAIGAGDIGAHFAPTDDRWRDAPSDRFLAHAARLVHDRNGVIAHVDLTIIGERPKISPHRDAIIERIAGILGVSLGRVSVKATTTERLGFTGRREGLAAMATATVRLPL